MNDFIKKHFLPDRFAPDTGVTRLVGAADECACVPVAKCEMMCGAWRVECRATSLHVRCHACVFGFGKPAAKEEASRLLPVFEF